MFRQRKKPAGTVSREVLLAYATIKERELWIGLTWVGVGLVIVFAGEVAFGSMSPAQSLLALSGGFGFTFPALIIVVRRRVRAARKGSPEGSS